MHDRLAIAEGLAKIAHHRVLEEGQVLDVNRLIETPGRADRQPDLFGRLVAYQHVHRIARGELDQCENQKRDHEQHRYGASHASQRIAKHGRSLELLRRIRRRGDASDGPGV
ncbi:hypothetical protein D9M72_587990 [compost metagenome]